jgi:hypothetical protein
MKNIFVALFLISTVSASAQVRWGSIVGVQSSGIKSMDLVTSGRQTNLFSGIMADIKFSTSGFHILTGALYAPMGYSKSNLDGVDKQGNTIGKIDKHRISYLQVPVYFSYGGEVKKTILSGGMGPYIAFEAGDRLRIKGGDSFGNGTVLPGNVKSIQSVIGGMGINFTVERSSLLLALHYQKSFSGIYESQFPDNNWQVNNFGLSLGYFFSK